MAARTRARRGEAVTPGEALTAGLVALGLLVALLI
jgi:hypothetical protein